MIVTKVIGCIRPIVRSSFTIHGRCANCFVLEDLTGSNRCDCCLVRLPVTAKSLGTSPFHGGNTGSNPVGDAKIQKQLAGFAVLALSGSHDGVTIEQKPKAQSGVKSSRR